MPKLWQFPATAPTFRALPQPDPPGSGFESNAPSVLPRARPAQTGNSYYPHNLPPPTADANPLGWEPVSPSKLKRQLMPGGCDVLPEKRPPVDNTREYPTEFPTKMLRRPMPRTFIDYPLKQAPAATAGQATAFFPVFPWRLPRRPSPPVANFAPLYPPIAAIAANPIGWTIEAPTWLPRRRTDAGRCEFTLFLPPAQTSAFPTGWEGVSPAVLPRSRPAAGYAQPPHMLVPAATSSFPAGWGPVAPVVARRPLHVGGWAYAPIDPMGALTYGNPLGWTITAPVTMLRRAASAPLGTAQPLNLPLTQVSGNPLGWESIAPGGMRRGLAPPTASYVPADLPPAQTGQFPLGWESIAPALMRKRPNDGTTQIQFAFGPLTPITLWYSFPASLPRMYQRPGVSELPLLAPFRPVEGWAAYAPVGLPRIRGQFPFTADTFLPITPPLPWNTFPAFTSRSRLFMNTFMNTPLFPGPGPAWGPECLYPSGIRRHGTHPIVELVSIWVGAANPHVASRRIVFDPPTRRRIEFPGVVYRRRVVLSPVVQRREP